MDLKKEKKRKQRQDRMIKEVEHQEAVKRAKVLQDEQDKEDDSLNRDLSTISIAIPGSILDNAQSLELRTYLAGQIARAACEFNIKIYIHLCHLYYYKKVLLYVTSSLDVSSN
jgi:hypothetical protein